MVDLERPPPPQEPLTLEALAHRLDVLERSVPAVLRDWERRFEERLRDFASQTRIDVERALGSRMLEFQKQIGSLVAPLTHKLDSLSSKQELILSLVQGFISGSRSASTRTPGRRKNKR